MGSERAILLELICARGEIVDAGRNANHGAALALVEAVKRMAGRGYGLVIAKAENARSRRLLGKAWIHRAVSPRKCCCNGGYTECNQRVIACGSFVIRPFSRTLGKQHYTNTWGKVIMLPSPPVYDIAPQQYMVATHPPRD